MFDSMCIQKYAYIYNVDITYESEDMINSHDGVCIFNHIYIHTLVSQHGVHAYDLARIDGT